MNELVKYIGGLLNIKLDSQFIVADITQDISTIRDIAAYRLYLRENLSNIDFKFMSGFQKFVEITKRYKKIETEAIFKDRFEGANKTAREIAAKVAYVAKHLDPARPVSYEDIKADGEQYFSSFEIKKLKEIKADNPHKAVAMQKSVSGDDMLLAKLNEAFAKLIKEQDAKAIANKGTDAKVLNLVKRAV